MTAEMVIYCGRVVPKAGFRAFIYGYENALKLVNSWEEYEKNISSGTWFPLRKDVPDKKPYKKRGD